MRNLLLDTDSYKFSHWKQYPPNTQGMFSYLESRGGRFEQTVFFGLQYILKEYLSKPISMNDIREAEDFCAAHGEPFNRPGFEHIVRQHNGYMPVRIRAVPEGTVVPVHNVLMTVESTDAEVFWIASFLETMLMRVWYPTTVATQSWHIRQIINGYLEKTSASPASEIWFKLHDFGSRGVSSWESAAIGGAAHLISFKGSDTVAGVVMANRYYNEKMAGFSIPATEHSTITAWGRDCEVDAYRNIVSQLNPGSMYACVSDSYNIYDACDKLWGDVLRQSIQESGGTLVVRPDSGNPVEVVSAVLEILASKFGVTYNLKGYKVLNNVRVIQGDGVDEESIRAILEASTKNGFSTTNLAFGMGGALLQKVNRDTQKFAYKCSEVTVNGKGVPVFKSPVTDKGKASKMGRLDLVREGGVFKTVTAPVFGSELKEVFENGNILKEYTLAEVRRNAIPNYE